MVSSFKNYFQHVQAFAYVNIVKLQAQKNTFWRFCNVLWLFLRFTFALGLKKEKNNQEQSGVACFLRSKNRKIWTNLRDAIDNFNIKL